MHWSSTVSCAHTVTDTDAQTKDEEDNGCHNNSAVTACCAHNNVNHAEELLAEKMQAFKVRWVREEGGRGGRGGHTEDRRNAHTQCTEVVCPVSDPSSLEQMNHSWTQMERGQVIIFYSKREPLFKLLKWFWSRVWQWDKLNNPPIIF